MINATNISECITDAEKDELINLLDTTGFEPKIKDKVQMHINHISDWKEYLGYKILLLHNQLGIDGAANPSQKEINAHIRKIAQ